MHDDAFYVPKEMFEQWAAHDPIERYRTWLHDHADLTDEEEGEITARGQATAERRAGSADASPLPDPPALANGVFASAEDLDTPHHK